MFKVISIDEYDKLLSETDKTLERIIDFEKMQIISKRYLVVTLEINLLNHLIKRELWEING